LYVSDRYLKKVRKIRQNSQGKPEERILAETREAFLVQFGHLPLNMKHDLFNAFVELYVSGESPYPDVFEFAQHLSALVDLYNREFDDPNIKMSEKEWIAVKNLTDEFAEELDIETLTYVMNQLLSGGYIRD
jgi:hypothetical protein